MHVQISRWGNSLGLRLPRSLADQIGINEGQKVSIVAEGNRLIVETIAPPCRLEDMLTNMNPASMREAFDWGGDAGAERVDE